MDKKFLESSEFYNKRFNNFSSLLIIPIACLFLLIVIFSFFMKREVTIESFGNLGSRQNIPIVQSPSNSAIQKNYLSEGKYVKKGDILLSYKNTGNDIKIENIQSQQKDMNDQIASLQIFQNGVESNQDTFDGDDKFGYRNLLKSYLNQRNIYDIENQMLQDKSSFSNGKINQLTNLYDNNLKQKEKDLKSYQNIFDAIKGNKNYDSNANYGYLYDGYSAELKSTSDAESKASIKNSYLNNLQQQIDSINDEISNINGQKDSLKDFDDSKYNVDSNNTKLSSLQNEQMKSISEELVKLKAQKKNLKSNLKELNDLKNSSYIKAKKAGVIHMNNQSVKDAKYVGAGSEIAEIYPILRKDGILKLQSYVSSREISSIKRGQHMRLEITRNVPRPILIDGVINNISVAPVPVNKGTYYIVTAESKNESNIASQIHYGMSGKTTIITGKETFFKYYKDKLLDKN
ncbi:bacteriocin secretion accessory protein [Companilactobacillus farciminis]|uniref:bacteriocin secretion accessory protein n=1 Tax=Companilactobacillus farciminis TaxID=1612 RepID=UPI00241D34C4|nr:bacteriocin secretion accessory protein [Companilactobacillus farciminis]